MNQAIAAITLGVESLARSRFFYEGGFGWSPIFENDEIIFYQMNGFVFATWLQLSLEADTHRYAVQNPGAFTLAHNVGSAEEVDPVLARLQQSGGRLLRPADAPTQGGYRGYVEDPDGHCWEIAFNPAWPIDDKGHVTFGV